MIERVLAPNPGPMTLTGTNTYLIVADGAVAVVDPGPEDATHLAAVLARATDLGQVRTVIVTHWHGDHLPAAAPLCAATGAVLLGHPELPGVQRGLADGEPCFGGLRAVYTPGHTSDSMCLWNSDSGDLFTGDTVVGTGTVVIEDHPTALREYMASLDRLAALSPRTIYPGHGPRVEDAPAKLREYIDHRRARERQVVDALTVHGPSTVDEVVAAVYVGLQPGLAPMAARNVTANLHKLASESRVVERDGRWQLTSPKG